MSYEEGINCEVFFKMLWIRFAPVQTTNDHYSFDMNLYPKTRNTIIHLFFYV